MKQIVLSVALICSLANVADAREAPDRNWSEMADWAANISKQQFGQVKRTRLCQPNLQTCSEVLFYRNKEHNTVMLRETMDSNDIVRKRDVCYFNKEEDIRNCMDWDSGRMSRQMKSLDGEWYSVDPKN